MTMTTSLTRSASVPPSEGDEIDAWLDAREAEIGRVVVAELGGLIEDALAAFVGSMTAAAGDPSILDRISTGWRRFVDDRLAPYTLGMFRSGGIQAWFTADSAGVFDDAVDVSEWTDVVNEAAVSFETQRRNHLVNIGDDVWRDVRARATLALQDGMSGEDLATEVRQIASVSAARAEAIARTETVGAYNGGELESMRALGSHGPAEKVWLATRDGRTRKTHADANEQVVPFGDTFTVGRYRADRPHDSSLPAAEVVNCRCVVQFLFEGDERPDGTIVGG